MLSDDQLVALAISHGFTKAAVMPVNALVYVPEYRKFCEENLCGNYNLLPMCPPLCGSNEKMHTRMSKYNKALVLQTEIIPEKWEKQYFLAGKKSHNELMDKLIPKLQLTDYLVMSAGPWKNYSCMSAYSIDAAKMADYCHMTCWAKDEKIRFFSSILF